MTKKIDRKKGKQINEPYDFKYGTNNAVIHARRVIEHAGSWESTKMRTSWLRLHEALAETKLSRWVQLWSAH